MIFWGTCEFWTHSEDLKGSDAVHLAFDVGHDPETSLDSEVFDEPFHASWLQVALPPSEVN